MNGSGMPIKNQTQNFLLKLRAINPVRMGQKNGIASNSNANNSSIYVFFLVKNSPNRIPLLLNTA